MKEKEIVPRSGTILYGTILIDICQHIYENTQRCAQPGVSMKTEPWSLGCNDMSVMSSRGDGG